MPPPANPRGVPPRTPFPANPGFMNHSRDAVTAADIGFHSAAVPSQTGMVGGSAKTLDRKPAGHTRI